MFSCPKPKHPLYHHLIGKDLAGHLHQRPGTPLMTVSLGLVQPQGRERKLGGGGRVLLSMEGP